MSSVSFTDAQKALIEAREATYVEACPGAGKTHAIVQRFIERPLAHPRKGVALISFTNAAIDEARSRCAKTPALTEAPNFVGTIDSFINRFLVGPAFLERTRIAPRFCESWSALPHTQVRASGVRFATGLDSFAIFDRAAHLRPERVPIALRSAATTLSLRDRKRLEDEAMRLWDSFVRRGTLSASASRVALRSYLEDASLRNQLGTLLSDRFVEVIIDEVQDCSADDILVLELLNDFGVTIIAVGDPDQSIYAFRSDVSVDVTPFLSRLARGQRLNGNFRSSPAICAAVDSLRSGLHHDEPVGPRAGVDTPVVLLPYGERRKLPELFVRAVSTHGIPRTKLVVVAHSADHARVAAGASNTNGGANSSNKLVVIALAHQTISDPGETGAARVAAMRSLERTIRELGQPGMVELDQPAYLEVCGLSERTFREACLRVATSLPRPFEMPPSRFRAALTALSESQAKLRWTAKGLRSPSGDTWPNVPVVRPHGEALMHSTIHGMKGALPI